MKNIVYLEAYYDSNECNKSKVMLPLESFISYCIYKYCLPVDIDLNFVSVQKHKKKSELSLILNELKVDFIDNVAVPWQVASCIFPVVVFEDTVISGMCAVARHICKYRTSERSPQEHEEGLLGFRKSCLQAPNEVSVWTKFCEIDIAKTVEEILSCKSLKDEIPVNLLRFENHLCKPVRVHNVYKVARDINKEKQTQENKLDNGSISDTKDKNRIAKSRKWKSKVKRNLEIDCSLKVEDLKINHQYAEGPFLTLADLILLPSFHILIQIFGETLFKTLLPLTFTWYANIVQIAEFKCLLNLINSLKVSQINVVNNLTLPETEDVSLYKCDPKRYNSKKRLFTKEIDIEAALSYLVEGMELNISKNDFNSEIDWNKIPDGANPNAGHLPDERILRKSQQLENLAVNVLNIAKEKDVIVDFCSGSGHLGILLAFLLPKCTVILLENKEQSLLRARQRVHDLGLKNVYFYQCNLDFFIGKFDIGVALHACGIASDLVLDKCIKVNAKFVLCPCCYGSLHVTDRLKYPRSNKYSTLSIDKYMCISHAADQTHEEHPITVRGDRCMAAIDSDRARLAEEHGYKVILSRLKPLTCTPKNNLLIGIPT